MYAQKLAKNDVTLFVTMNYKELNKLCIEVNNLLVNSGNDAEKYQTIFALKNEILAASQEDID